MNDDGETKDALPMSLPVEKEECPARKALFFALRLGLGFLLIWLVFSRVDINKIGANVMSVGAVSFITAFFLILIGSLPGTWAWMILNKPQSINASFLSLLKLNFMGFFFNSYLPTGVGGHLFRGYALAKETGKVWESVASTVAERITAFAAVVIMGVVSVFVNYSLFQKSGLLLPVGAAMGVVSLAFIVAFVLMPGALKWGKGLGERFFPGLSPGEISHVMMVYRQDPLPAVWATVVTMLSQFFEMGAYAVIFAGLGYHVQLLPLLSLVPIMRFLNHVPLTWNSLGTQDLILLLFWKPLGLSGEQALSVSLLMHAMRLALGAIGGGLYVLGWKGKE